MSETPASEPSTGVGGDAPAAPATSSGTVANRDPLRRSRTSGVWVGVVLLALVLLVLIIFIAQNTQSAQVTFLGWEGSAPVAVSLLIATVAGMLLVVIAASLRMLQVRRRVSRERR